MKRTFHKPFRQSLATALALSFLTATPLQAQNDFLTHVQTGWNIWTARNLEQENSARFGQRLASYQLTEHQQGILEIVEEKLKQAHEAKAAFQSKRPAGDQAARAEFVPKEMLAALKELCPIWEWYASEILERSNMRVAILLPQGPKPTHIRQTLNSIIQYTKYLTAEKSVPAIAETSDGSAVFKKNHLPVIRDYAVDMAGYLGTCQMILIEFLTELKNKGYLGDRLNLFNPDGALDLVATRQELIRTIDPKHGYVDIDILDTAKRLLEHWHIVEELALMEVVNQRLLDKGGVAPGAQINPGSGSPYANGRSMGARFRDGLLGNQPSEAVKAILRTDGYVGDSQFLLRAMEMRANAIGALQFVGVIYLANLIYYKAKWIPKEESWDHFVAIFDSWKQMIIFGGSLYGFNWLGHALIYGKTLGIIGRSTLLKGLLLDTRAMYYDWKVEGAIRNAATAAKSSATSALEVAGKQATKGLGEEEFLRGLLSPPSKARTARAIAGMTLRSLTTLSGCMVAIDTLSMLAAHPYWQCINDLTEMGFHSEAKLVLQRIFETTFMNSLFLGGIAYKAVAFTLPSVILELIATKLFLTRLGFVPAGVHLAILQIVFTLVGYLLHKTLTPILTNNLNRDFIRQKKEDYLKVVHDLRNVVTLMDELDGVIEELGITELFKGEDADKRKLRFLRHIVEDNTELAIDILYEQATADFSNSNARTMTSAINAFHTSEGSPEDNRAFEEALTDGMARIDKHNTSDKPTVLQDPQALDNFKFIRTAHAALNLLWSSQQFDQYKESRELIEKERPHLVIRSREHMKLDPSLVKLPRTNAFLEWLAMYHVSAELVTSAYAEYRNRLGITALAPIEAKYTKESTGIKTKASDLTDKVNDQIMGEATNEISEAEMKANDQRLIKLVKALFLPSNPNDCDYLKSYPEAVFVLSNYKIANDVEAICRNPGVDVKSGNPIFEEVVAPSETYRLLTEKPPGWRRSLFNDEVSEWGSAADDLKMKLWSATAELIGQTEEEELTRVRETYWHEIRAAAATIAAMDDFEQAHLRATMIRFDIQAFDADSAHHPMCGHDRCQNIDQRLAAIAEDIGLNKLHHLTFGLADQQTTWSSLYTSEMAFWQDAWMDYARYHGPIFGIVADDPNYWLRLDQRTRLYDLYVDSLRKSYFIRSLKELSLDALDGFSYFDRHLNNHLLFMLNTVDPAQISPRLRSVRYDVKQAVAAGEEQFADPDDEKEATLLELLEKLRHEPESNQLFEQDAPPQDHEDALFDDAGGE